MKYLYEMINENKLTKTMLASIIISAFDKSVEDFCEKHVTPKWPDVYEHFVNNKSAIEKQLLVDLNQVHYNRNLSSGSVDKFNYYIIYDAFYNNMVDNLEVIDITNQQHRELRALLRGIFLRNLFDVINENFHDVIADPTEVYLSFKNVPEWVKMVDVNSLLSYIKNNKIEAYRAKHKLSVHGMMKLLYKYKNEFEQDELDNIEYWLDKHE